MKFARFFKFAAAAAIFTSVAVSDTTSFTIHVIGDSTVCNYNAAAYPQTGWGQILGSYFDDSRVNINNVAIGGRSSKTFIQEGRLNALQGKVQKGDFVFVQFGHNDRYFGNSSRQVPIDSLDYWLQQYVDKTKSWGATPVFVSPMIMNTLPRNTFSTKYSTKGEYDVRDHMEALAKKNQIPFVDLNLKSYNGYKAMNAAYVSRYQFKYFLKGEYPNYADSNVINDGTTHFQESGSITHTQWIMEELEEELNASYLSADAKTQMTKLVSTIKPRYNLTVKSNVSNGNGLISHSQKIPGGAPLVLHVSPGSFGKKFQYWADDDCKKVTADSNYYKVQMPYRDITYTAIFEGGAQCVATSHGNEQTPEPTSSSSSSATANVSSSSEEIKFEILKGTTAWPSISDLSYPNETDVGWTEANHVGFTGKGFFNFDNAVGRYATYKMTSYQSASNARMFIRYCNGKTTTSKMNVQVDAMTYEVEFPPSASWDSWDTVYVDNVWLDACDFDLKFTALTSDGGPNVDMVGFDIKNVYRIGAEPKEELPASSSSSGEVVPDGIKSKILTRPEQRQDGRTVNLLGRSVSGKKLAPGKYFKTK